MLTWFLFGLVVTETMPPEWECRVLDALPMVVKHAVWDEAVRRGYGSDALEIPALEQAFSGVVYVLRMRRAGTPLPWPADPVFGRGKP